MKVDKYSKQREVILYILKKSYEHPTANDIYKEAIKLLPTISKGTVYRNLTYLVDKNIIIKISILDGPDRFDYMKTSHHHAICKRCTKVFDFNYDVDIKNLKKKLKLDCGFDLFCENITVEGICLQCKKELKN